MGRLLFWFCLPWLLVLLIGAATRPGFVVGLGAFAALLVVMTIAMWRQEKRRTDRMLADAQRLTRQRQAEDRRRTAPPPPRDQPGTP